jgi:very-short-patch-repair endonuclease
MISQGLSIIRFSNDRVLSDTASVIEEIRQALTLLHHADGDIAASR